MDHRSRGPVLMWVPPHGARAALGGSVAAGGGGVATRGGGVAAKGTRGRSRGRGCCTRGRRLRARGRRCRARGWRWPCEVEAGRGIYEQGSWGGAGRRRMRRAGRCGGGVLSGHWTCTTAAYYMRRWPREHAAHNEFI